MRCMQDVCVNGDGVETGWWCHLWKDARGYFASSGQNRGGFHSWSNRYRVYGFLQCGPCVWTSYTVHTQALIVLKRSNGFAGAIAVVAVSLKSTAMHVSVTKSIKRFLQSPIDGMQNGLMTYTSPLYRSLSNKSYRKINGNPDTVHGKQFLVRCQFAQLGPLLLRTL